MSNALLHISYQYFISNIICDLLRLFGLLFIQNNWEMYEILTERSSRHQKPYGFWCLLERLVGCFLMQ